MPYERHHTHAGCRPLPEHCRLAGLPGCQLPAPQGDGLSFTEAIAYKQDIDAPMPYTTPVYIIEADRNFRDDDAHTDDHRFKILRLLDCDYRPDPPTHKYELIGDGLTWQHLEQWEMQLRARRQGEVAAWLRAQNGKAGVR